MGSLTDEQLSDVVRDLKKEFPSMGGTMLWGQLRAMGFVVESTIFCTRAKQSLAHWYDYYTMCRCYSAV